MASQNDRHLIRCGGLTKSGDRCEVVLGARMAGAIFVRKDGFEMIVKEAAYVRCDRCGTTTSFPAAPQTPVQEVIYRSGANGHTT